MPPKRYREGSPNTVLRSMSSEESGNSMNINSSQNTLNSRNNGYGGFSNNENGNLERTVKRRKNNSQPQPPLVTAAQAAGSKQKANYEKLRIKRNSLPRGLYNFFSNTRLQNAVNRGRYQNMNTQINSKIKLANNHERRIKNQLNKIPNGIFRRNTTFKINNVIGNNSKTTALLQQINTEQKKINANAKAKAAENAKKAAAKKAAANKAAENAKKAVRNRVAPVNLRAKRKAAAAAQATENARAAANNARRKANANARAAANNARRKANANAKAKAANANAKVKTENTDRMSGRTSCPTNIRPLIQQLNNFENTANSSIKSRNKKPGEKKPTRGKLMKDGVLLEILSLSRANAEKKNAVGLKHRAYVFALLYDMFSSADLPATFFEQNVTITRNSLLTLAKHLMCVNTYSSSSNNFKSQEFTLTDMQITEFLFLMWLDGWHDKYINTSFEAFLPTLGGKKGYFDNKYINNSWKIIKDIVPENMNNNYTNRNTLIARILSTVKVIRPYIYTSTFKQIKTTGGLKGKFETPLRDAITKLLGYQMTIIPIGSTSPSINATNKHMVLLDMESEGQNISQLINASKKLNPYLASASLIDPGRHYLKYYNLVKDIRSIRSWFEYANQNESFLNFNTRYHVGPTNMILKDSNGNIFLNVNLTVNVSGVKQTNLSKISNDSFFTLTLNNKEVNMGTTAGNAKNAGLKSNMGKFMGDALQYMTVIVQNNTRSRNRVFASGDGNACFMYTHLCKCIGQTPRIIIDKGGAVVYHGID